MKRVPSPAAVGLALGLGASLIAGCASKPLPPERPKFDTLPHEAYLATGNSTIRGQVFLRERGDTPVPCTDAPMIATPATRYFRQVIRLAAKNQMPLVGNDVDPDYRSIVKIARCDTRGFFAFDKLPPGDWYVVATVSWAPRNDSGLLTYKVRLRPDQTIQIVMTDRDIGTP